MPVDQTGADGRHGSDMARDTLMSWRRWLLALALCTPILLVACNSSGSLLAERRSATTPPSERMLPRSRSSPSNSLDATERAWATSTVVEVEPVSLAATGPRVPSGQWTEGSAVTDDVIAIATWPREEVEQADARWRLVVARRDTGELLFDDRVGDMNVVQMFAAPSGEVMIVEPLRSADWNFADGFVVHGYDPDRDALREVARFDDGDLYPASVTFLPDGRLGVVGTERNGDVFDQYRMVVFDWQNNETVMDVVLEELPIEADAPDGVFVEPLGHATVWDEERNRVLVVHAHEDVITTVDIPTGDVGHVALAEDRSVLEGLLSWFVPAAHAKGLPGSQRQAVMSGEHLYVAGEALAFQSSEDVEDSHAYTVSPTDMLKIDLETLRIVERAQPGVTAVAGSPSGGYLVGAGVTTTGWAGTDSTTIGSEEHTGLLVIDPDTLEVVSRHDDVHITSPHEMQLSLGEDIIYVRGPDGNVLAVDPTSGGLTRSETRWFEPSLLENSLRYDSHQD